MKGEKGNETYTQKIKINKEQSYGENPTSINK